MNNLPKHGHTRALHSLWLILYLLLSMSPGFAQTTPAHALKQPGNGNPLLPFLFTADPTAVEYEGRLYVYATNDTEEFIARGRQGGNTYGAIRTLAVMSTDDMVNWTFHGLIPACDIAGSWSFNSWAPSIVSREEEDGKTHFYLYFSNSGAGVGVLTATSPVGPWTAPRKTALVDHSTPGVGKCAAPMDPGVVIDDEGTGWIAFGGGDSSTGSEVFHGNARIARLKPNLTEIDGEAAEIPAPYHFEANELNYMDGKWVYTYCSLWGNRDDWSQAGTSVKPSSLCSMDYMVSTNPLDPSSWKYAGEYFANPGNFGYPWYNNHTHLHKYNGQYYLLYHTNWLEAEAKLETGGFRCVSMMRATVREKTAFIGTVTANNKGVSQIKALNPYATQQAETMGTCAGLDYDNFVNAVNNNQRLSHKSLAIANIPAGAWVMVRGADFGADGAGAFKARLRGRGTMEVRLDGIDNPAVATVEFSSAGWREVETSIDHSAVKGKHDIYFYFPETKTAQFDEWCFTQYSNGIRQVPHSSTHQRINTSANYDLSGRRVLSGTRSRNVIICGGKKLLRL